MRNTSLRSPRRRHGDSRAGRHQPAPRARRPPPAPSVPASLEQATAGLADVDERGVATPTAAQKSAASGLVPPCAGTRSARRQHLARSRGTLGAATSSDAVAAARVWLAAARRRLRPLRRPDARPSTLVNEPEAGRQQRSRGAVPPGLRRPGARPRQHGHRRGRRRRDPVRLLLPRADQRQLGARRHALAHRRLAEGGRGRRPRTSRSALARRKVDRARSAGPGSRSPASPRSSRSACAPSRWPTAPCVRSSRPTSSTSRAALRRRTPCWSTRSAARSWCARTRSTRAATPSSSRAR